MLKLPALIKQEDRLEDGWMTDTKGGGLKEEGRGKFN
jgi:hypothetical protein